MLDDGGASDRATLDAMTAFLKAHLIKSTGLGNDGPDRALAETAVRFNETDWFWTDDNAKAAELLAEPGAYDRDPAAADAAIDFVLGMSQGAIIQRRGGPAELRLVSADPAAFRVETAFFIVEGDLSRGFVRHALRFNDNRTVTAACHAGHAVSFRLNGRAAAPDVRTSIAAYAVDVGDRSVILWFTSLLHTPSGHNVEAARVTYRYAVHADHPSIGLTVHLMPAPGCILEDVVLTTALDGLARVPRVHYRALGVRRKGDEVVHREGCGRPMLHPGPADYAVVMQEGGAPGFNYAMHLLLPDGDRLAGITGSRRRGGRLRTVVARYALGRVTPDTPPLIREERMLTGGGYYEAMTHYAEIMTRRAGGHGDPSMSYDIGAELNALAVHLLFARRGRYASPPSPERLAALQSWYDRHVQRYFAFIEPDRPDALSRVFSRGIAFVILSLDCMIRATGEPRYHAMLQLAVGLVLRLGRRRRIDRTSYGLTFADVWSPKGCFLDCHAACLLGLARAARHGDPHGTIGRAIHEGVAAIRLYRGVVKLSRGHREPYIGLAVAQRRIWDVHVDTGFWTFKVGIALRALHAICRAAQAGVIPMSEGEARRVAARIASARQQIARCCRRHGDMIEVPTSSIAGETNSETQPWVALGWAPIVDEAIERLCPADDRPLTGS